MGFSGTVESVEPPLERPWKASVVLYVPVIGGGSKDLLGLACCGHRRQLLARQEQLAGTQWYLAARSNQEQPGVLRSTASSQSGVVRAECPLSGRPAVPFWVSPVFCALCPVALCLFARKKASPDPPSSQLERVN